MLILLLFLRSNTLFGHLVMKEIYKNGNRRKYKHTIEKLFVVKRLDIRTVRIFTRNGENNHGKNDCSGKSAYARAD